MQGFRKVQWMVITLVAFTAIVVVSGWFLQLDVLKSLFPGLTSMKINTALLFILCSVCFAALLFDHKNIVLICALTVLVFSALTIYQDIKNVDLKIDQIFYPDVTAVSRPGRMAPLTALCFIMLSSSFLLFLNTATKVLAQWLIHCVTLLSFIAVVGYLLQVPAFYTLGEFTSIAPNTAILFFLMSIALSLSNPTLGLTGLFTGEGIGNKMARTLFPMMVVIILLLSGVRMLLHRFSLVTVEFGIALQAISFVVTVLLLIYYTARILNKSDAERSEAEKRLTILNNNLENEVVRRTEQVKESESLLKNIIDNTKSAIFVKDLMGRYTLVNKEFANEFNLTPEQLYLKTAFDIFPPDLAIKLTADEDEIINKQKFKLSEVPVTLNGNLKTMLTNKFPLVDNEGKSYAVCGIATDITPLVLAEANLKAIFNSALVSIIETEVNGIIKNFNRGAEILLGYSASEMIGKHTPELIHAQYEMKKRGEELTKQFGHQIEGFDVFVELAKRGSYESREWTYIRKDGSSFPVQLVVTAVTNNYGQITGFLGIATDISEIKNAQKEVAKTQQITTSIINTSTDGIVMQDNNGVIIMCNDATGKILGLTHDQMIGKKSLDPSWKFIHEDGTDFPRSERPAIVSLQTGQSVRNKIIGVCKRDGLVTWILVNSEPILGSDNLPYAVVTSFTDITALKIKEEKLSQSLDILSEQNKRLLNFAHIVSHNLKSHSNNIKALIEFYKTANVESEKQQILEFLTSASVSLKETVSNLTQVVDIQNKLTNERQRINILEYLEKTLDVISGEIKEHHVEINIDVAADLFIEYNPAYLESIFLNFITNAIKYRHPKRHPTLNIKCEKHNEQLILEFSDNGVGIDLEKYGHKLFGMYSTFHGNKDAKGIGLFITKNQVEAMGGKIEVSSIVDEGTTFRVFLN